MPNWKKLVVSGSDASLQSLVVSQSVVATSFSGSLLGTASDAVSASYAISGSNTQTASFSFYSVTASYVIGGAVVQTSSYSNYAVTASYVATAQTASWMSGSNIKGSVSSSYTASLADLATLATTASYAHTASWVDTALTASWVESAFTASYISASNVDGKVAFAAYSDIAGITVSATSASYADTASFLEGFSGTGITITVDTPALTWSLDHSLNTPFPIINIWESGSNEVVQPDTIKFIDNNHTEVTFTTPVQGYAAVAKAGSAVFGNSPNYTASIAITASYVVNAETASYVFLAVSASNVETASYAYTASKAFEAETASYSTWATTASFAVSYSINSVTQSNIASASWASQSLSASYIQTAQTASFVSGNVVFGTVASAFSSSVATTASYAITASWSATAVSASYIATAQTASYISTAQTASYVTLAQSSSYVSGSVVKGAVALASTASYISASNISGLVATASFANTASYAINLLGTASQGISSSFAATASYVIGGANVNITLADTAPAVAAVNSLWYNTSELSLYVRYQDTSGSLWWTPSFNGIVLAAISASYTDTTKLADSSSFTISASFVKNAQTASYFGTNNTASYAATASFARDVAGTASYAATSSFAKTASFVQNAVTASYLIGGIASSSFSSASISSSYAATASYAIFALSASAQTITIPGGRTNYIPKMIPLSATEVSLTTGSILDVYDNTVSDSTIIIGSNTSAIPLLNQYRLYVSGTAFFSGSIVSTGSIKGTTITLKTISGGDPLIISASNTRGGTNYADFLTVRNVNGTTANSNKFFRLNPEGSVEMVNSAYSATVLVIDDSGSIASAGTITPSRWNAGDIIQMRAYKPGDSGVFTKSTSGNSTTNETFFSCSFTPKSDNSYVVVEVCAKYENAGGASGNDDFFSTITIGSNTGTEIGYGYQKFLTTASQERCGVLFPLSGRYTNSSTSTIVVCANVRRGTADDYVTFDNTNASSMTITITEIGR